MGTILVNKKPSYEEWITLVELMTYYKLSYPVGVHESCEIHINDKDGTISNQDTTYKLSDYTYMKLHLITNEIIASLYKTVLNDKEI